MSLFSIVGWGVLLILGIVYGLGMIGRTRLRKAREQYAQIRRDHGSNAPYHCPHGFVSRGRDAESGLGRTWCRVCGKHIGTEAPAAPGFGFRRG